MLEARIISVGSEMMLGQLIDTNAAWLSQRLAEIGIAVVEHITVADDQTRIEAALAGAAKPESVVLVTGGLGPTEDDLTRHALATVLEAPLELHEESLDRIREFFRSRGRKMADRNAIQAMFPHGSEPLENPCGTAPGIRALCGDAIIYVTPGVPREMKVMFDRHILPDLMSRSGGQIVVTESLHCFGTGESDIGQQIADLMEPGRQPAVGTRVDEGVISVRIVACGHPDQARQQVAETAGIVEARLGTLVFGRGDDTLASAVGQLLQANGQTVAVAESCTGGLIAKWLTDVSGSSAYFLGGVVAYANTAKRVLLGVQPQLIETHGAVSEPVARAMACGCRERFGTDFALAVTGIAGPGGGTTDKPVGLVYTTLADTSDCRVVEHRFGAHMDRHAIRRRTASAALNMLRLHLLER